MDFNEKLNRIITARNGKIYAYYPEQDRRRALSGVLTKHYRRKGQSISPENLIDTVDFLDNDVRDHYGKELTYSEVEIAIEWGIRGEYGELTGLNADRLFRFIKSYVESPERKEAARRVYNNQSPRISDVQDVGRANWDAVVGDYRVCSAQWRQYHDLVALNPSLAEYDFETVTQRHRAANVYRLLKAFGFITLDDATLKTEDRALDAARRRMSLKKKAADTMSEVLQELDTESVRTMADCMMLANFFRTVEKAGIAPESILDSLEDVPEEDRRFYQ